MEIPLPLSLEKSEMSVYSVKSSSSMEKRKYNKRTIDKIRRWSLEECQKYEDFILNNEELMNGSNSNRATKIFLMMSEHIGSKTPTQCRSHHQKFYKRVLRKKTSFISENLGFEIEEVMEKKVKLAPEGIFEVENPENNYLSGESIETNHSNDEPAWQKPSEQESTLFWDKNFIQIPILNILTKSDDQMNIDWLTVIQNAHRRNSSYSDILDEEENMISS